MINILVLDITTVSQDWMEEKEVQLSICYEFKLAGLAEQAAYMQQEFYSEW